MITAGLEKQALLYEWGVGGGRGVVGGSNWSLLLGNDGLDAGDSTAHRSLQIFPTVSKNQEQAWPVMQWGGRGGGFATCWEMAKPMTTSSSKTSQVTTAELAFSSVTVTLTGAEGLSARKPTQETW